MSFLSSLTFKPLTLMLSISMSWVYETFSLHHLSHLLSKEHSTISLSGIMYIMSQGRKQATFLLDLQLRANKYDLSQMEISKTKSFLNRAESSYPSLTDKDVNQHPSATQNVILLTTYQLFTQQI